MGVNIAFFKVIFEIWQAPSAIEKITQGRVGGSDRRDAPAGAWAGDSDRVTQDSSVKDAQVPWAGRQVSSSDCG